MIGFAAAVFMPRADALDIIANQLLEVESAIYFCETTPAVSNLMAVMPVSRYRELRSNLPAGCRVIVAPENAVALIARLDQFGVIYDVTGLALRPFLLVVVDIDGRREKGVAFLSADIELRPNPNLPDRPVDTTGSVRELLGR